MRRWSLGFLRYEPGAGMESARCEGARRLMMNMASGAGLGAKTRCGAKGSGRSWRNQGGGDLLAAFVAGARRTSLRMTSARGGVGWAPTSPAAP